MCYIMHSVCSDLHLFVCFAVEIQLKMVMAIAVTNAIKTNCIVREH
jgi:hypothetical protein